MTKGKEALEAQPIEKRLRAATMRFDWSDIPDEEPVPAIPLLREAASHVESLTAENKALKAHLASIDAERDHLAAQVATIRSERDEARQVVRDTLWMAQRYADGRKSYAVGMFNDASEKAFKGGYAGNYDKSLVAKDGMWDATAKETAIRARGEADG